MRDNVKTKKIRKASVEAAPASKVTAIVADYKIVADIAVPPDYVFVGWSSSAKHLVPKVFGDTPRPVTALDIGFGRGDMGNHIKQDPLCKDWVIDGIDGFYRTCCNVPLFENCVYRNVWHGLVQDLDRARLETYDLICFFDVIEHLDASTAKRVLTDLLTWMKPDCKLAIGTPLWFLVQSHGEEGDLEPHLCGVPVTSLLNLAPVLYNINKTYLVGTFILDKSSLAHIDKFEPTTDRAFDEAAGLALVKRHGLIIDERWHQVSDGTPAAAVTPPPQPVTLKTIVENYKIVADIAVPPNYAFVGGSSSAKHLIPLVFGETPRPVSVLDIGFGTGNLGTVLKNHALSRDWAVDAIDGYYRTCCNIPLFESGVYRTVWHGLVQHLDRDTLASYDLICFFDVIEHLDAATAREVLKNLLTWMKPDAKLAIGTPLWYLLQGHAEEGDLEPHLCGIPVTSLLSLSPSLYNISRHYLVGTFILDKSSLAHIDKFEPTSDRAFNEAAGRVLVEQHGLVINDQWNLVPSL